MYKVYFNGNDFLKETTLNIESSIKTKIENITDFKVNSYLILFTLEDKVLLTLNDSNNLYLIGDKALIKQACEIIYKYKLEFENIITEDDLLKEFFENMKQYYEGKLINNLYQKKYNTLMVAGGCFWCMAKPYNEYDGVINVRSGYAGGFVYDPSYKQVKSQQTGHKEVVKILYDPSIITTKELLKIYFEAIDPFDDLGQFIDRGESYTTALFTNDLNTKAIFNEYVEKIEAKYNKKVTVKLLPDTVFYEAEDFHQDYALKNEEAFKEEERLSKRDVFEYIKID